MTGGPLARITDLAKLAAAALLAASGLRLATVGWSLGAPEGAEPAEGEGASHRALREGHQRWLPENARTRRRPAKEPGDAPSASAQASPSSKPHRPGRTPKAVRVNLAVTAGPEGSRVYVQGRPVGISPFVGDVVCIAGEKVKIEVLPPKGMPLVFARICEPGTPWHVRKE